MKKLITLICLLCSFSTFGQVFYNETSDDYAFNQMQLDKSKKQILENHIGVIQIFKYKSVKGNTDSKGVLNYESKYNDKGQVIEHNEYNKKGKLIKHFTYEWDANGKLIESLCTRGDKFLYKTIFTYDADGNEIDQKWWYKNKNKLMGHQINKYGDKHNVLETSFLYYNDKKQSYRYVYSYYPDGSKKQTIQYNKKGKAMHTWNYDCKPEGAMETKKLKDTSKMCVRYELDKNGDKIKIVEEAVKKGKIARIIHKYNKDNYLLDEAEYNAGGKVVTHNKYDYDNRSRIIEIISFAKKSSIAKKRWVYHYDNKDNLTDASIYKNGKDLNHTLKYTYIQR